MLVRERPLFRGEPAITGSFLKGGTRSFDEKETDFVIPFLARKRMAGDDNPGATMPFTQMVKSKLNFGPNAKRPLGQKANPFGRPPDLFLNQID